MMRRVGSRKERLVQEKASGLLLADAAQFSEALAHLAPSTFVPKGVYRFPTHEEANRHQEDCLAQGMARLAAERIAAASSTGVIGNLQHAEENDS